MTWNTLGVIFPVSNRWQFTPFTAAYYFRISHFNAPPNAKLRICQSTGRDFFEAIAVEASAPLQQIFRLSPREALLSENRRIGLKAIADPGQFNWRVQIDASDQGDLMPISNPVTAQQVSLPVAATVTSTTIAAAAVSTAIVAANPNRKGLTVFNNSTSRLYLDHDAAVTLNDFTVYLEPGGFYEIPREYAPLAISGIWASANGNALVREFV